MLIDYEEKKLGLCAYDYYVANNGTSFSFFPSLSQAMLGTSAIESYRKDKYFDKSMKEWWLAKNSLKTL